MISCPSPSFIETNPMLAFHSRTLAALVLSSALLTTGCSSITEGIVRGVLPGTDTGDNKPLCRVVGPAFTGIEGLAEKNDNKKTIKVVMVHGIGPHKPGYATRFAENLADQLDLNLRAKDYKQFGLKNPLEFGDDNLGEMRVSKFFDEDEGKTLLFYELTWSSVFDPYRANIAYDSSGEYAHLRTPFNHTLKTFANDHLSDPVIYMGEAKAMVNSSFTQAYCWMASRTFDALPDNAKEAQNKAYYCSPEHDEFLEYIDDEIVFVSHSLGSRLVMNGLNYIAKMTSQDHLENSPYAHNNWSDAAESSQRLQQAIGKTRNKHLYFYMLSNQLPLLQLAQPLPPVLHQHQEYCSDNAPLATERFAKRLDIIAFSDPNDLLSYGIPNHFIDKYVDSRLCGNVVNAMVNIAEIHTIPGLGEVANPMTAHKDYDNDDRVIAMIAHGIGHPGTDPLVQASCDWKETR